MEQASSKRSKKYNSYYRVNQRDFYNRRNEHPGIESRIITRDAYIALREASKAYHDRDFELAIRKHPQGHRGLIQMGNEFVAQRYYLLAMMAFEKADYPEGLIRTGYELLKWDNYWLSKEAFAKAHHKKGLALILDQAINHNEHGIVREIVEYQQII